MFDWLKPKSAKATQPVPPLFFKSGDGAIEFASSYLNTDLRSGAMLPAVVIDAGALLGKGPAVTKHPDGNQTAMLRVASKDGGFIVFASSASASGPELRPGDLVAWQVGQQVPEMASQMPDPRSSWVGLILAKLKPEYKDGHGWAIDQPFK